MRTSVGRAVFALVGGAVVLAAIGVPTASAQANGSLPIVHAVDSAGTWANAQEVPGTAALNAGGDAAVDAGSCPSAGDCAAAGTYVDGSGHLQAFVVDETDGIWGNSDPVLGLSTLDADGIVWVYSLSCASVGDCAAAGAYTDGSGHQQAYVVDETNGVWGSAEEVPGTAALNSGGGAGVYSLSCRSAGDCAAAGGYTDGSDRQQAFVVDEKNGVWGLAEEIPGTGTLDGGGNAYLESFSCASAGNCAAAGSYAAGAGHLQAFVVDETNGVWGLAKGIPGMGTLNTGGDADVGSLSCPSPGHCAAGGYYEDASDHLQAFVVSEVNAAWGTAEEVPGTAALNAGGSASVYRIPCASAGNCSAGGGYYDGSNKAQAFVVDETNGTWGDAEEVPGTGLLNAGDVDGVSSLSCTSAGNCSASGQYRDPSGDSHVFVVDETNGTWGDVEEVPGTALLNVGGYALVSSLSCAPAGYCAAGGYYTDSSGHEQAFVADYGSVLPTVTRLSPTSGPIKGGTLVSVSGTDLSGASVVNFGSDPATHVTVVNNDELTVSSPAGVGTVDVTVTTPSGTSAVSSGDRYTYVPPPTINALTPTGGAASGGTVVTLYGINFVEPSSVQFGSDPGTHVTIVNSGELKVTAPAGTGTVNVTVATPGGISTVSRHDRYSYFARPIVNGISPASGRTSGGTVVTVYGVNFGGPSVVRFGTCPGTQVTIVNSGELKVKAPAGRGTVNVTVATPGGTSAVSSGDRFKYT